MFIEGLVSKPYARLLGISGYVLDLKIENEEQREDAIKKGYEIPEFDMKEDAWVRFFVTSDIKDFLSTGEMIADLKSEELPLLLGNDEKINALVEKELGEK